MLIVLSQKLDSKSAYNDSLFVLYHYPARYKNQIKEGDSFVYYQGDRCCKDHRFYFGAGEIGKITCSDDENYYAELRNCYKFKKKVSIYLADGGYVEQLGVVSGRKTPPWQSSIRDISQEAYNYILQQSQSCDYTTYSKLRLEELATKLKEPIKKLYLCNDYTAAKEIEYIAHIINNKLDSGEKLLCEP